jgi:hypothetical protein
VIEYSTIKP